MCQLDDARRCSPMLGAAACADSDIKRANGQREQSVTYARDDEHCTWVRGAFVAATNREIRRVTTIATRHA